MDHLFLPFFSLTSLLSCLLKACFCFSWPVVQKLWDITESASNRKIIWTKCTKHSFIHSWVILHFVSISNIHVHLYIKQSNFCFYFVSLVIWRMVRELFVLPQFICFQVLLIFTLYFCIRIEIWIHITYT